MSRCLAVFRLRLALGLGLFYPGHSALAAAPDLSFHIPAEPLSQAIIDLAVQARLSIGHAGLNLHQADGNPVEGRLTARQALDVLLAGSGFGYVFLDADTVNIVSLTSQTTPPASGASTIEDVVVTATKRPAVAQTLPESIVTIGGAELAEDGAVTTNDLARHAAGVTATNLGAGQDKLFLRGLSDSVLSGRTESMVGLYLDESRIIDDAPDPALRLTDIDRIEVVRGPQSTLFGDGALGGVVRMITNQPNLERSEAVVQAGAALTAGGDPSGSLDVMANIPLIDDVLGLRAVGYAAQDGGYIDDVRLRLKNVNQTREQGGRLALRWAPVEGWNITLRLVEQVAAAADSQYVLVGLPDLQRANYEQEPHKDRFREASMVVEGALSWASLTSTSSYTDRLIDTTYDASIAWPALTGFPLGPSLFNDDRFIRTFSHETRLNSVEDGDWRWVGGVTGSHRDESYHSRLAGPGANGLPFVAVAETRDDHADQAALFGEATYRLTDWLDLTAGVRLLYASTTAEAQVYQGAKGLTAGAKGNNAEPDMTHKAVISVHPLDDVTLYASLAQGFRLGGINIDSPAAAANVNAVDHEEREGVNADAFKSDTLQSYELGAKSSLLDGALIANGALFLTFWDNIQSDQILSNGLLYIANAGNVRAPGVETDLSYQVTSHIRLQANAFWSDPTLSHGNPLLVQTVGRLPGVPESSAGASLRYDFSLPTDDEAFIALDGQYIGRSYAGFDVKNSPPMGDYLTADIRLGWQHDPWRATLFVDNIGNTRADTFAYGNPFTIDKQGQSTPLRPLTIGLSFSRSF